MSKNDIYKQLDGILCAVYNVNQRTLVLRDIHERDEAAKLEGFITSELSDITGRLGGIFDELGELREELRKGDDE